MNFSPGTRLGPYEILSALGAGGMGEVYRARDTALNRQVALKLLPDAVSNDSERIARFAREAQILASLNHPHIGAIYGIQQIGDARVLVLELVEGETLAAQVSRGRIPTEEAVAIALQIAEALEAAHEKGVIHRDLKPANVALTGDGQVKVLDFGLAKAVEAGSVADGSHQPTITTPAVMTGVGAIMGTAAYMSPEQAKGRPADKRSDVWAFGCVVYEMLTGVRVFGGEDVADTLAAVLRGEPDWALLPGNVPRSIRTLLQRCLDKDRRRRVADMSTVRYVLDQTGDEPIGTTVIPWWSGRKGRWMIAALGTALAAIALAVGVLSLSLRPAPEAAPVRFALPLPERVEGPRFADISRDGSTIVYVLGNHLAVRRLSELTPAAVRGTEITDGYLTYPTFSPDGQSIVFWWGVSLSGGELRKVSTAGGAIIPLARIDLPSGISWGDDGIVLGEFGKGIVRIPPNGGSPEPLMQIKPGEVALDPQVLPGGALLYTFATGFHPGEASTEDTFWDRAQIFVLDPRSGVRTMVLAGASAARYATSGHLLYVVGDTLFAAPFDLTRKALAAAAAPVVEHIQRTDFVVGRSTSMIRLGSAHFRVSDTGSLLYVPAAIGGGRALRALSIMDRHGVSERVALPPAAYEGPRISPDGKRVAYDTDDGKEATVWVYDLSGTSAPVRITFGGRNRFPVWSPDGTRLAFQSDREGDRGIFWQPADGNGGAARLTPRVESATQVPEAWSASADAVLYSVATPEAMSLWVFSVGERKATRIDDMRVIPGMSTELVPPGAVFSPDGRWLAYATRQAGNSTIIVRPFPVSEARYQITQGDDGHHPLWSPDGKEVFYIPGPRQFSALRVTPGASFLTGKPFPAITRRGADKSATFETQESPFEAPFYERNYDVTHDGAHFIRVIDAIEPGVSAAPQTTIQVVLNWFTELKRLAPLR